MSFQIHHITYIIELPPFDTFIISIVKMKKMMGYRKPKAEVVRALHIAMIILCTLASVAIFFLESIFNRVIISAMMIAYAIFLLKNSHILRLIFQLPSNESSLLPI